MIKRPLNAKFRDKVMAGTKVTTIRAKAWPEGVPIMLYSWSGKPYASKHENLTAVRVDFVSPIWIKMGDQGKMEYELPKFLYFSAPLWTYEGFESQAEMDDWFSEKMKPGERIEMVLMIFLKC